MRRTLINSLVIVSVLAMGGGLGLLLATWLLQTFVAFGPTDIPRLETVSIDTRVLGFTAAVTIVTGLLF